MDLYTRTTVFNSIRITATNKDLMCIRYYEYFITHKSRKDAIINIEIVFPDYIKRK